MTGTTPLVGILMGSKNDWEIMSEAKKVFDDLGIACEARVLSAHRTPDEALDYAAGASERGLRAIIAGAGGAAHLAGVLAAKTLLPVLAVPINSTPLLGLDSLLAMVQMPKGIPVATFAIGKAGAGNAALYAAQILALQDETIAARLTAFRESRRQEILAQKLV
ncbi:MAG: 5-(carboxyamino)imidazole ribonucleotide mutase [Thermoanaerobaculia bacterium]